MVPETGIEPVRPLRKARDFKSLVSTYFTTRAACSVASELVSYFTSDNDTTYFQLKKMNA